MAKKVKPTAIQTTTISESASTAEIPTIQAKPTMTDNDGNLSRLPEPVYGSKTVIEEANSRLEELNRTTEENANLFKANTELTETLAKYISEIKSLKDELNECKKNVMSADDKKSLTEFNELKSKISSLEKLNKTLQDENDNYLMKISELTFENAKMNAKMNSETERSNSPISNTQQPQLTPSHSQMRNPFGFAHPNNNGYDSWN